MPVASGSKYAAEGIGTFFLVLTVGCCVHTSSICAHIAIGSILMALVYTLGSVSGAHFNPAVTLAVLLSKRGKISPNDAGIYMVVQVIGGVFAALLYWSIFREAFFMQPGSLYTASQAGAVEIFYSAALCYVVLNVATTTSKIGNGDNGFFGMAIGFTVVSSAIAMGGVSGCSLNPAVSFGALLASYLAHGPTSLTYWAVYIFAPFGGSCVGYLLFWLVQGGANCKYEYMEFLGFEEEWDVEGPPEPVAAPPPAIKARAVAPPPAPKPRPAPVHRKDSVQLSKGDVERLPEELYDHELILGLKWRVKTGGDAMETLDIDASCVKYDRSCHGLGAVYFAMKDDEANGIHHMGDEITGAEWEGGAGHNLDNEQIRFKLSSVRNKVHALFFVANIFTAGDHSFKDVEEFSATIRDSRDGRELCRFDKRQVSNGNFLVVGMLYRSQGGWCFKAIDDAHTIMEHGTYRAMEPFLEPYCRRSLLA